MTTWTQMDVRTLETPLRGRDELKGLVVDPLSPNIVYASAVTQPGGSIGAITFVAQIFRGDTTRPRGLTGNASNQWAI